MALPHPAVDYRRLRLRDLGRKEFSHLKLLLYWPLFGLLFLYVERLRPATVYFPVSCAADAMIPFCEWFLIPYLFWFVYLIGIHLYTLLYDVKAFRNLMKFVILTYSLTILLYLLFPTRQQLRPAHFDRDTLLTRFIAQFYQFDTNTNVCPSLHVIGSLAVLFTAWNARGLTSRPCRAAFTLCAVLICLSTLFLKQHSLLDVLAALPICLLGWLAAFRHSSSRPEGS